MMMGVVDGNMPGSQTFIILPEAKQGIPRWYPLLRSFGWVTNLDLGEGINQFWYTISLRGRV